jgi:hypothetical protein
LRVESVSARIAFGDFCGGVVADLRDKIVVTIEPSAPSERLDIADAFQQVLDYLRLIELAASEDADFDWKLERATTNSPFTVVAYTPVGSVAAKHQQSLAVAQRKTEDGLKELARGHVPTWMRKRQRNAARRITRRFHDNIGRMSLKTEEDAKGAFLLNRQLAAKALTTLDKVDGIEEIAVPKHTSYGEIEGLLLGVGSYYSSPALWVRVNGYDVVRCLVKQGKLDELGDEATLKEVWTHRRVRIVGTLSYADGGALDQVTVDELHLFPDSAVGLRQILDPDFTGGMEPVEYLDRLNDGGLH